jgi:hypothetical protein
LGSFCTDAKAVPAVHASIAPVIHRDSIADRHICDAGTKFNNESGGFMAGYHPFSPASPLTALTVFMKVAPAKPGGLHLNENLSGPRIRFREVADFYLAFTKINCSFQNASFEP